QAQTEIVSFEPEELFGTKLRALLQRRKNRDLFDLDLGLTQLSMDLGKIIASFEHYLALEGTPISRAVAEQRMLEKFTRSLTEDIAPLLPSGVRFEENDAVDAFGRIWKGLIVRIQGEPWKLSGQVIEELRRGRVPLLLQ
ncbi:MAG TPA: nucleotidyl transferase AbiEii/AbiGii toxin family protein, partial [Nitrospira sp.]|nr:nucleotidyl transferase AbiEii/AbiGii toxin family protein [Nitrospira sp.]